MRALFAILLWLTPLMAAGEDDMGKAIAPQWGRTVTRQGTTVPANQQLVRLDFDRPTDVTLYLSGFEAIGGGASQVGLYDITWGCSSATSQQVFVPQCGMAWHVTASRIQVNAQLNHAGFTYSLTAQAFAGLGRPDAKIVPLPAGGSFNPQVEHVLPVGFSPRYRVPRFTRYARVSAFNVISGTPTVRELASDGTTTLITRPAADYIAGASLEPRCAFVELEGGEYNVLVFAEVWE